MPSCARILVVDDDLPNLQTLTTLLTHLGHKPTVADCGERALELLESPHELDLVISDVMMPGMNGIDFAKRVGTTRPGMPVVLVTGDRDAVDLVLSSGAVALLKPYSIDRLQQVLSDSLEARRT